MFRGFLSNRQLPFWLIAFSAMIGLTLPTLIQDGMFMDAMLYTSVSHNLSLGIGTFWFPQFSLHNIAGLSSFHEQPPLVFGIQALFFKLFGSSMYVERLYTFFTMCITAALIVALWKIIFRDRDNFKKMGWLPLLFWIGIPLCFWSYSNNMHENTMGIFTLCAVLLSYKAMSPEQQHSLPLLLGAGLSVFLATLSKGIPGFFPLALPVLYWLIISKTTFRKALWQTLLMVLVPLLGYSILFAIPGSRESLSIYLFKRALHRISEAPTVDSRFWIMQRLFMELLPQIGFVLLVSLIARMKTKRWAGKEHFRTAAFWGAVGLAASAPLMLTLVQKGFYFVPSLPFFAIGFAMLIVPVVSRLPEKINVPGKTHMLFLLTGSALFTGSIIFAFMQKGKVSRNPELMHDLYLVGAAMPAGSAVSIPPSLWNDWDLQCNLMRSFNISVDPGYKNKFCIIDRTHPVDSLMDYRRMEIGTVRYDLYRKE